MARAAQLEIYLRIFGRGVWGKPDASRMTPPAAASGEAANPRPDSDILERDAGGKAASTFPHPALERLIARARALLLFERCWRLLVPPLIVAGLFLCLSFTGIWLETPHWRAPSASAHSRLALALSLLPLRNFHAPTRREALERIDRVSGLAHRPAAVLDDRLGNAGDDAATLAFWSLHRRRAERAVALLRTGPPSPRVVDVDRYALRAAVLVGLIATGFIAGPEKYARVAAAFDWRFGGLSEAGQRIDAWVDPPAYTGAPADRPRPPWGGGAKDRSADGVHRRHSRLQRQARLSGRRRPRRGRARPPKYGGRTPRRPQRTPAGAAARRG